jgi:hypothetical protein
LYVEALTSFSAHWSGNIYSQPYDWGLASVSPSDFAFSIDSEQILGMTLGGDVYYDPSLPLIWDFRPTAVNISPDPRFPGQYYGTGPFILTATAIPEPNDTFLLLAIVLSFLFGFARRRRSHHVG